MKWLFFAVLFLLGLYLMSKPAKAQGTRNERRPSAIIILEPEPVAGKSKPIVAPEPANGVNNNFGINRQLVGVSKDAYTVLTQEAARFVISANDPGKSDGKSHVTIVGDDDERARVVNDIATHPAFASVRDSLLVQDYKPGEWSVDPALGFQAGKPSIYVQSSRGPNDPKGGRVIWRQFDYSGGPEGLAKAIITAKRKADPDYKPDKDPSPDKPTGPESGYPFWANAPILFAGLVFLLVIIPKKGS